MYLTTHLSRLAARKTGEPVAAAGTEGAVKSAEEREDAAAKESAPKEDGASKEDGAAKEGAPKEDGAAEDGAPKEDAKQDKPADDKKEADANGKEKKGTFKKIKNRISKIL